MATTSPSPIDVVRAFNDAMVKMDFDTALTYVADECEYTTSPS